MTSDVDGSNLSLKAATQVLDRRVFAAGAVIFSAGDPGTVAYILLRGDVSIYTNLGKAEQRMLTTVKPGQMFGELALMAGGQRTASARTETGCELLSISREKLEQKLKDADPFLRYWIEYLSKRVIELTPRR
jgi:CRP-like cAMP-binding protein